MSSRIWAGTWVSHRSSGPIPHAHASPTQHWIAPPPPRPKFYSPEDVLHLEDESGRVTLVGERIHQEVTRPDGGLVTGVVMAALGMETASGDFEVIDLCYAGLPPVAALAGSEVERAPLQEKGKGKAKVDADAMDVDEPVHGGGEGPVWVALVSGLSSGSAEVPEDLKAQLLAEWLMGEGGAADDRLQGQQIARVIFAGNSLSAPVRNEDDKKPVGVAPSPRIIRGLTLAAPRRNATGTTHRRTAHTRPPRSTCF